MKSLCTLLAVGALAIGIGTSAARADSFSVTSVPTNTNNFGYLSAASNSDVLLVDLNGAAVTINGANFAAGGATGTGAAGVTYALTGPSLTPYNGPFASGASDPNVGILLSDFYYGGSNPNELLTINGLNPNAPATITVLGAAFGAGQVGGREEQITGSDGAVLASYEENNGAFSTLSYTGLASAGGTLSIASLALDGNGDTLHFYGFTVAEVPEPSSVVALTGLGVMGLFVVVRRRRRA